MCSEVRTGRNSTNGTCIDAIVPMTYQDEYEMYSRCVYRPIKMRTKAWSGTTAG
jgi:hypothetical protein